MLQQKTIENTELDSERLMAALKIARSVCHEMAQPLMTSIGFVELLMLQTHGHSEMADKLNSIHSQMNRLSELTKKLMNTIPKLK
jgi:C4-dicarboxylate-specific signal transduction histidine kinase